MGARKTRVDAATSPGKVALAPTVRPGPLGGSPGAFLVLVLYCVLAAYLVPVYPHGASANEQTRWATAASIVERGTFEISWTEPLLGPIVDTARVGARVYSNKAPTTVLVALPGYLASRPFLGEPDAGNIRVSWTLMRWIVSTAPLVLFALSLIRRRAGSPVVLVALFATPLFLYGLILFSHVLAGAAVYGSYRLLFRNTQGPSFREALLAGVLAGLAVSSEFPAVFPVLVFGLALLLLPRGAASWAGRVRPLLGFVLGGVPFAAGLALYNAALFGSPFAFSYAHESFPQWSEVARHGVFGIGWPDPRTLWLLVVSPSRGLLFTSPILILSFVEMARVGGPSTFRLKVRLAAVVLGIVALSGHGAAHGGWAAGPRYLVFLIPLLIEPLLERGERRPLGIVGGALLGASFVLCVLPALTFPFVPPELRFPHATFWRPLLLSEGWATPTLGALLGLGAGLPALIPAMGALLGSVVVSLCESGVRCAAGAAAGIVLAAGYSLAPGLDDDDAALRRAAIAERFFRSEGRLERFRALVTSTEKGRYLESMIWQAADIRAWAPSGWPYTVDPPPGDGPTALGRRAHSMQGAGKLDEAERLLRKGREEFPGVRCDLTDQLAVILYLSGKKDEALAELEAAKSLSSTHWSAGCRMVMFHLASLYQEGNRRDEALVAYETYLARTAGYDDAQSRGARDAAEKAIQTLRRRSP